MSDAETFLDALFSDQEQWVAVRFGRHDDGVERRYWWPDQRAELVADARRESDAGRDVYACPAGRFNDQRRKGDGRPRPWAWTDVDHALDDEQDALARKLDGITVLSGSPDARHLHVRLTRPVGVAESEALNRALRDRLDGDAKWSDESLLRVPGTLNYKSDPPRPVVLEHVGVAVWDPDDLAALLGVGATDTRSRTGPSVRLDSPEGAEPPDPLPDPVAQALARRADQFREGRSGAHHNLVGEARRAGLTLGQTVTVAAGYLPSWDKYGDRLASEVARSWATVDTGPVLLGGTDDASQSPAERVRARFGLLTRRDLATLPPVEPLIADTLDRRTLAVLAGYWGTGKSFLALDWACCVATGKPWQGRAIDPAPGRVLYIVGEGAYGVHDRITAWETAWAHQVGDLDVVPSPVNLMDPREVEVIAEHVGDQRYDLVVVDTLSRSMPGADENAAKDMSIAVASLDRIRNAGLSTCVLAVHHTGKDRTTVRGSSVLEAAADTVYTIEGDGRSVELSRTKRKDGPRDDRHRLGVRGVTGTDSAILSTSSTTVGSQDRVLSAYLSAFHGTGASKSELRNVASLPPATFHRALSALVREGTLLNHGTDKRPFYRHHDE